MSEVRQDIGANPGSPNVPTRDRGSGMGVAKVRCAATRPELRQSGGKVTWRVGRQGVGDGEVVRKLSPRTNAFMPLDALEYHGDRETAPENVGQTNSFVPLGLLENRMNEKGAVRCPHGNRVF
ncbi:uncharacterized protein EI90DRAFT_3016894 [Cantharellus anzutake]|uniref:uncharacterized protein n=1 Tax=Cantharellus anzutake TaxID=1750568 RepID=UPI001907E028|nr:uncharacterized protein EI90DRAFT_3016894 [Cantharellus anzutake]KAF8330166.1 hypothetical protein EI90DRAFT_3016894 [Cantharellus anzutake]